MEKARTAGSAGTCHPQPSRPSCHGFVRSRWVRESQRLKLLLQETRASKKAPRSRGLSVSIKSNRSLDVEETAPLPRAARVARSEERRVGKECVRTGRSRGSPYPEKKKSQKKNRNRKQS